MNINKINCFGTYLALLILITNILIFLFRLRGNPRIEYWLGVLFLLTSIPIVFLLLTAKELQRPPIYYIQLGLMLVFIIVEFLLDYFLKVNFRNTRWMVIMYATLFFASTGGMIGIASLSGKIYSIVATMIFLIMAFLAFFQRVKTGK
jgi:hypothetical protein